MLKINRQRYDISIGFKMCNKESDTDGDFPSFLKRLESNRAFPSVIETMMCNPLSYQLYLPINHRLFLSGVLLCPGLRMRFVSHVPHSPANKLLQLLHTGACKKGKSCSLFFCGLLWKYCESVQEKNRSGA